MRSAIFRKIPILGVCLGHQSIARAFGGKVIAAKRLMHGKTSAITGDGKGVFAGIKQHFQAMRYHSLAVEKESLPDCLAVTATSPKMVRSWGFGTVPIPPRASSSIPNPS
jgi:anthranilate synthase/aminodeoxychorismate synthase-like glutamine amidotransferase